MVANKSTSIKPHLAEADPDTRTWLTLLESRVLRCAAHFNSCSKGVAQGVHFCLYLLNTHASLCHMTCTHINYIFFFRLEIIHILSHNDCAFTLALGAAANS